MAHPGVLLAAVAAVAALLVATIPATAASSAATAAAAGGVCRVGRVALTFDDGPGKHTPRLLHLLQERDVRATFFVLGQKVGPSAGLLRTMAFRGHVVGNHTWNHQQLTGLSSSRIRGEYRSTTRAIVAAGAPRPTLARPPYGSTNSRVRRVEHSLDMHEVLWTVDPTDWDHRTPAAIVHRVMSGVSPGPNVVILHDGVANSGNTVRAVPTIIHRLRSRGYCLVTLDRRGDPRAQLGSRA